MNTCLFRAQKLPPSRFGLDMFFQMFTKSKLRSLLNEGDITEYEEKKFYADVRAYLEAGVNYALKSFAI